MWVNGAVCKVALVTGGTRGIGLSTQVAVRSQRIAFRNSMPPQICPPA